MNDHDIELLERYVDDELSSDEVEVVERHLADDETWAAAHVELLALRSILRDDVEAAADAADFGGFFAAIEARLPAEQPAQAAVETPSRPTPAEPGLWARLREWWSRNWTPVLLGAAVAAAVVFWLTGGNPQSRPDAPMVAEHGGDQAPVVIDAVSNEGDKTVLISMPSDEGGSTVIWLLDEEQQDAPAPPDGEDPI